MRSDAMAAPATLWLGLLLGACSTVSAKVATLMPVACLGTAVTGVMEPLDRPGLSAVRCQPPDTPEALLLITDENITWPVLEEQGRLQSLEGQVLAGAAPPGAGHAYHDEPAAWAVLRGGQTLGFVYRVRSNDPVTLEPVAGFVAVTTGPGRIRGTAGELEKAAALITSSD